jgi:hypothetical protein
MEICVKHLLVSMAVGALYSGSASADVLRDAAEATIKCQAEADAEKRLACLEAATQQLQAALAEPTPVIDTSPSTPAIAATVPSARNKPQPEASDKTPVWAKAPERPASGPDAEAEPEEIEVTVVTATESFGRYTFVTSDGQIWKMTQSDRVKLPKDLPTQATIKRKLTGNPMIQFTNVSRAYRVMRVR